MTLTVQYAREYRGLLSQCVIDSILGGGGSAKTGSPRSNMTFALANSFCSLYDIAKPGCRVARNGVCHSLVVSAPSYYKVAELKR
jgi:hypothetical protein